MQRIEQVIFDHKLVIGEYFDTNQRRLREAWPLIEQAIALLPGEKDISLSFRGELNIYTELRTPSDIYPLVAGHVPGIGFSLFGGDLVQFVHGIINTDNDIQHIHIYPSE